MSYISDSSTQLTYNPSENLSIINNTVNSTYQYVNFSDLSANLATKQDLLTSATNLLGIGSAITALDYNKITLNKPTNFQSDWNTTIINKPTNFQSDWNSTIINKPTNFQSDWNSTIINKPTNFQSDYNSTVINTPNLSVYLTTSTAAATYLTTSTAASTYQPILTFNNPLLKSSNTVSFKYNPSQFNIDSSGNLALISSSSNYWTQDISNNLYYTSGKVGIGKTNPTSTLDVSGNITFSGTITGSGTGLSALNASNISSGTLAVSLGGAGVTTGLSALNASNVTSGTLPTAQGGTGVTTGLTVLNASNVTTGTLPTAQGGTGATTGLTVLNASNITSGTLATFQGGTGTTTGLTVLNASNITSGTLSVSHGGTGSNTLTLGQILIGNGSSLLQSSNLYWDSSNNILGIQNPSPIGPLSVGNAATSSSDGYLVIGKNNGSGGSKQYRIGMNSNFDLQIGDYGASNVAGTWVNNFAISYASPANSFLLNASGNVILGNQLTVAGTISGPGSGLTSLNASNISSGILSVSYGGTGTTTSTGTGSVVLNTNPALSGNVGIGNTAPIAPLTIGNASGVCDGYIVLERNDGAGNNRQYRIGVDASSNLRLGDYGYSNTVSTWVNNFSICYASPANSFYLNQYGDVILGYNLYVSGIISGSGSRISAINASNVTSGTLGVAQGGTGTTTSTGTGSVVLSTNPTISGLTISGSANVTNLNTTSYVYSSSTSTAAPTTGTLGGSGDRLILYQGGTSIYPYSLGINTSTLWYSVPTGISHNFFVGGTSNLTISSGNIGIQNTSPIAPLTIGNASLTSCDGNIVLEYHNGSSNRQYKIGINSNSDFQIGDYGYSNIAGTWVNIFSMSWAAPANSFYLNQYGNIVLGNALSVAGTTTLTGATTLNSTLSVAGTTILTGAITGHSTLQLATTQSSGFCLRIEGGTSTNVANAISIGGYGKITVDYPSVAGGRLTLDDSGNLNLPRGTLAVAGATILGSTLSVTGSVQGNQYFCINSSVAFTTNWNSTGNDGCFIGTNQWWNNGVSGGFCYLNVCIQVIINSGSSIWMGRIALSGTGGVLGFYQDYTVGSLTLANQWDTSGNNAIRISSSTLSIWGGTCYYKIYG